VGGWGQKKISRLKEKKIVISLHVGGGSEKQENGTSQEVEGDANDDSEFENSVYIFDEAERLKR
jgi:hypothetical protein